MRRNEFVLTLSKEPLALVKELKIILTKFLLLLSVILLTTKQSLTGLIIVWILPHLLSYRALQVNLVLRVLLALPALSI